MGRLIPTGRRSGQDAELLRGEHARAFRRHIKALNRLLDEVREYVPDANYYLANDTMSLMSGDSHDRSIGEPARQDRIMDAAVLKHSSGGDW